MSMTVGVMLRSKRACGRRGFHASQMLGILCGWETAQDKFVLSISEDLGSYTSCNLGLFMVKSPQKDPRICGIKKRDHHQLAS